MVYKNSFMRSWFSCMWCHVGKYFPCSFEHSLISKFYKVQLVSMQCTLSKIILRFLPMVIQTFFGMQVVFDHDGKLSPSILHYFFLISFFLEIFYTFDALVFRVPMLHFYIIHQRRLIITQKCCQTGSPFWYFLLFPESCDRD